MNIRIRKLKFNELRRKKNWHTHDRILPLCWYISQLCEAFYLSSIWWDKVWRNSSQDRSKSFHIKKHPQASRASSIVLLTSSSESIESILQLFHLIIPLSRTVIVVVRKVVMLIPSIAHLRLQLFKGLGQNFANSSIKYSKFQITNITMI